MNYEKYISVTLEHSYFADGKCPSLWFEPTEDCSIQMNRHKLLFYHLPQGFIILTDTDNLIKKQAAALESLLFDTAVYSQDRFFGNYSNLEIDYRQGRVYYVGTALKTGPASPGKRITLSVPGIGREIEAVPVQLKPKQFVISLENAAPGDTFKLLDRNNTMLCNHHINETGRGTLFYVDAVNKPPGLYSLQKNDTITGYFYLDDLLCRTKPAFIIGIDATSPNYHLRIANRAVTWQYHVIARSNGRKLKNLEILNNNEKQLPGISFPLVRLDETLNEAIFESNMPIPVSEKAYQSIELIEKDSSGTPLIPHLANAGISTLHVKEGKWVARIYVHI
ncbi:MAG TPA: hypothetical protein VK186_10490 [Candidatus Deferrimicrobium sp.]|nr:hypothetical protein [Candidatus Deferrimicrobium sp.]